MRHRDGRIGCSYACTCEDDAVKIMHRVCAKDDPLPKLPCPPELLVLCPSTGTTVFGFYKLIFPLRFCK